MVFYILLHMFIILPALIIVDGWEKFSKFLTRRNLWWKLPYMLLFILVVILIILLMEGYR